MGRQSRRRRWRKSCRQGTDVSEQRSPSGKGKRCSGGRDQVSGAIPSVIDGWAVFCYFCFRDLGSHKWHALLYFTTYSLEKSPYIDRLYVEIFGKGGSRSDLIIRTDYCMVEVLSLPNLPPYLFFTIPQPAEGRGWYEGYLSSYSIERARYIPKYNST